MQIVINTVITTLTGALLGYFIGRVKKHLKNADNLMKEIEELKKKQLVDMRSNISNKFYVYDALEEVEDYLYASFMEDCEQYFERGGNSYIKNLYERAEKWEIKHTGIMKDID